MMELDRDSFRTPTRPTWALTDRDRRFLAHSTKEAFEEVYPPHELRLIDRDRTRVDSITREAEQRVWKDPVLLHGQVRWEAKEKLLTQYGLEVQQAGVVVTTAESHLHALGVHDLEEIRGASAYLPTEGEGVAEFEAMSAHRPVDSALFYDGDALLVEIVFVRRAPSSFPNTDPSPLPEKALALRSVDTMMPFE